MQAVKEEERALAVTTAVKGCARDILAELHGNKVLEPTHTPTPNRNPNPDPELHVNKVLEQVKVDEDLTATKKKLEAKASQGNPDKVQMEEEIKELEVLLFGET